MCPDNSGIAFPFNAGEFGIEPSPGMSIRDWFAGQAMTAIIAADGAQYFHESEAHARLAYNHADAMLAARKGGAS